MSASPHRGQILLLCLVLLHAPFAAGSGAPGTVSTGQEPALATHLASLYGHDERLHVTPHTLEAAVPALAERLGAPLDPAQLRTLSTLDPSLADTLGQILSAVLTAHDARTYAYAGIDDPRLVSLLGAEHDSEAAHLVDRVDTRHLQRAALTVAATLDETMPALRAHAARTSPSLALGNGAPATIDLAPVLVVDPDGVDNLHTRDAVLVVDLGGNDVYDTNAGGALIHQGLVGDPDSCQLDSVVAVACENEDALVSFSASLLIDLDGDDTYGVHKPPRVGSRDAQCTSDPIIRRVVVQGSGSGGLGMLVDVSGADAYRGKTLAQGNGHLGGVGALFDLTGDDTYDAIRSSMGSSVLGGTGSLYDHAGDDRYVFRAPMGGLWNVDRAFCDDTARLGLGAAVLGGSGHLTDAAGNDTYRIMAQGLGFANVPDVAHFLDGAGHDDYGGYSERANDVMRPGPGVFIDTQS